jgi:hypothetical protein
VNDALGGGGGFLEGVDVGHHIVAEALLPVCGGVEVDCVELRFHLSQRVLADARQTQLALGAGELEPELAPQGEFVLR